jgi:hypothetical protein
MPQGRAEDPPGQRFNHAVIFSDTGRHDEQGLKKAALGLFQHLLDQYWPSSPTRAEYGLAG